MRILTLIVTLCLACASCAEDNKIEKSPDLGIDLGAAISDMVVVDLNMEDVIINDDMEIAANDAIAEKDVEIDQ